MAAAWDDGGTEAVAAVLAECRPTADDAHLWAVVGEIVAQLPASDPSRRPSLPCSATPAPSQPRHAASPQPSDADADAQLTLFDFPEDDHDDTHAPHWADVLTLRPEVTRLRRLDRRPADDACTRPSTRPSTCPTARSTTTPTSPSRPRTSSASSAASPAGSAPDAEPARRCSTSTRAWAAARATPSSACTTWPTTPRSSSRTDLGQQVTAEAEQSGARPDLTGAKVVTLTADYFTPGATSEAFGPATNLFERFIWSLVDGDMDRYQRYVARGSQQGHAAAGAHATPARPGAHPARRAHGLRDGALRRAAQSTDAEREGVPQRAHGRLRRRPPGRVRRRDDPLRARRARLHRRRRRTSASTSPPAWCATARRSRSPRPRTSPRSSGAACSSAPTATAASATLAAA